MVGHVGHKPIKAGRPHAGVVEEVGLVSARGVAASTDCFIDAF